MKNTVEISLDTWMPPDDAYVLAKQLYGLQAGRDRTTKAMPPGTVEWGPRARGEGRQNPLDIRAVKVHLATYIDTARALDEADRAAKEAKACAVVPTAKKTLEARVAALEAAFDALMKTTKEVA